MSLIIDGYNLLHAAGITGGGRSGQGGLRRSRQALLSFLAAAIDDHERSRTIVVFDAREAPPGLPRSFSYKGLTVRFAPRGGDADTVIEELIRQDSTPRRLTVVSSDHRLQRAARRRRAQAVDADVWYGQAVGSLRHQQEPSPRPSSIPVRPAVPLLQEDVDYWLRQFGGEESLAECLREGQPLPDAAAPEPPSPPRPPRESPADAEKPCDGLADLENPFPPGYGEDLEVEEDAEN